MCLKMVAVTDSDRLSSVYFIYIFSYSAKSVRKIYKNSSVGQNIPHIL